MLKMLGRLYLILVMTYGIALYVIPELVLKLFDQQTVTYNRDQARGTLTLIKQRFDQTPHTSWPALEQTLDEGFAPLRLRIIDMADASLSTRERLELSAGEIAIRLGDYGTLGTALTSLEPGKVIELTAPPAPVDIYMSYWLMNILIGAALLGCLLLWVKPHWRDLQRLKHTAMLLGDGKLAERTHIAPSSNIGELAQVFDTMAQDIERLLNQQQDLLNAVSHELRTPLSRLEFGMALVLADPLQDPTRRRLEQMVEHVRELDTLIDELLSYNRLQTPRQQNDLQSVPLPAFLDSIVAGFMEAQDLRPYRLTMHLDKAPDHFVLDPRLTARAIQNLLGNAVRYCETQVHISAESAADGALLLSVEDDGIGIPPEERQRIFEPFYRMDRSRDRDTGGFGLGLAISKRAIECQAGRIEVTRSALGGACLRIFLPAKAV